MKLDLRQFRLEAPQVAADQLPPGFAQSATNCRVLSGNLEAWKQDTAATRSEELVTKSGTIKSIHLMDIDGSDGGPFLLHWPVHVDVAKGPIGGDTTERTYFTGDGVPKVTNIELATTAPGEDPNGYPHSWEALGVPSPTDAPVAAVDSTVVAENEIALTNPGAESGVTGWTVVTGTLLDSTTQFYAGTHSFASNDAVGTEAFQEIDTAAADLGAGQLLQLLAQLRGSGSTPSAQVRLEAWGGSGLLESVSSPLWTDASWTQWPLQLVLPNDTVAVRIYMKFSGAVDSAWVDSLQLFVLPATFYSGGTSLSDWSVGGSGGTLTANIPAESFPSSATFRFTSNDDKTVAMYRDFNSKNSPLYKIDFQHTTHGDVYAAVCLDVDAAGAGWQVEFGHDGVYLEQTGGWGSRFSTKEKIGVGKYTETDGYWWHGTLIVESIGAGKKRVTVNAYRMDTGANLVTNATAEFTSSGDYIGFKGWCPGDSRSGYLDEIYITVNPAATTGGSGANTAADYVYTIGSTALGALSMSGPSPASNEVQIGAAPVVSITTETTPPAGYDASVKFIWRRVTGSDGTTTYRLVLTDDYPDGEIPISVATIIDTNTDDQLGSEIPDVIAFDVPPADGHSIVTGANGITYIASKNQVYPSPVNQPHAYPPLWAKATDYPIVGLATLAADVYALTQAHPYVIIGSDPSALDMEKLARPLGCVSKRSIATDRRLGVVYASSDGLAYANKADVGLLTEGLLTEREWRTFRPEEITGCIYDGSYVGFNSQFGFIIDLTGKTGIGRLDFVATALFVNPLTGDLHMVLGTPVWVLRSTPVDNQWNAITYGGGLFVAVAYSGTGNRVMTSPDGENWTLRASPADYDWRGITYGNGLFVAVAGGTSTSNRVMTSPDGITWTLRASANDAASWMSVTYGNGLFVAVTSTGTDNCVMTSPDGITWTMRTAHFGSWMSVTYGNGLFVAVASQRIMTSPDGITWTMRTSPAASAWTGVTYGNGRFVAVAGGLSGTGNRAMTSPDGITWTAHSTPVDNLWISVAYGGGLFVAVAQTGTGNRVMTSPDGENWTLGASAADDSWQEVAYGNGRFVAVSIFGTAGARVMTYDPIQQHVTFNTASALRTFTWRSGDVLLEYPTSFWQARVDMGAGSGNVTLDLFYDGQNVHSTTVSNSVEFNLTDDVASHDVSVRVSGSRRIRRITLVEDPDEFA